jgi:hypothetical protein
MGKHIDQLNITGNIKYEETTWKSIVYAFSLIGFATFIGIEIHGLFKYLFLLIVNNLSA